MSRIGAAVRTDTANWISTSEYDLDTARHMLATGRYLYVVFMCHLALEKMLKAHATDATGSAPARTHDLLYLVKSTGLRLPLEHLEFVGRINNASVVTRYPEDLQRALAQYPVGVAREYLHHTEEVLEWLKEQLTSRP